MYGIPETGATEPAPEPPVLTGDLIQAYVARGRRLRAEAMAQAARIAVAALGRWLADWRSRVAEGQSVRLSHDLRTPLTAIRASSELLIDNPDMPQEHRRRFLDAIHKEALRLERTVDTITGPAASSSRA